jgi:hypothetical protein
MPISFGPTSSWNSPSRCACATGPRFAGATALCRDSIRSLEHWGVVPLFTAVVLGITWMAIVFATITWRHDEGEPTPQLVTT